MHASQSSRLVKSSQSEKSSRYNEKEQAELATHSAFIIWGGAEVCASRSSQSVKSSQSEKGSR